MSEDTEVDELREFNEADDERGDNHPSLDSFADEVDAVFGEKGIDLKISNAKMWAQYGNTYSPCEKSVKTLPVGQYTIESSNDRGIYFNQRDVNLDELMILPDSASEEVIEGIETFWTKEAHFRELKFLWKRGVMLWGPAGSGKTSTVQIISQKIVELGGLAIYIDHPGIAAKGLELLRRIEPKRPLLVILEDIDAIVQDYGESSLLALLDGETQIDNVVFIATTNYPGRLDKRLRNRPSRFDVVKKIGMPSPAARKLYLEAKNVRLAIGENEKELEEWVSASKGMSLAHIKELIISVEVFEIPLNDSVERLRAMANLKAPTHDDEEDSTRKIGFGPFEESESE